MLAYFIALTAPADLEALQGTWSGDQAATLTIRGNVGTFTDGSIDFVMRLEFPRPEVLRFVDSISTLVLPWRVEDGTLRIGERRYRRTVFPKPF